MKNIIIFIIKLFLGISIIYWLYQKGSLDFTLTANFIKHPALFLLCITLGIVKILLNSYRWKRIINNSNNKKIKLKETLNAEWSSLFFSTILPGTASGDILRVGFLKKEKLETSFLILTVLFDRFLGFFGLITLALFSSLLFLYFSKPNVLLIPIILTNIYIFTLLFILTLLMISIKKDWIFKIVRESPKVTKFFVTIFNFFSYKKELFFQVSMSTFSHVLSLFCLWIITNTYSLKEVPLFDIFIIAPLGLLAQVIPLTPSGIGIGHAAFDYLFKTIEIDHGASIFNVFWIINLLINLLGFIPFLQRKKD